MFSVFSLSLVLHDQNFLVDEQMESCPLLYHLGYAVRGVFVRLHQTIALQLQLLLCDEGLDEWFACDATPNQNAKLGYEAPYMFADLYRVDGGIWPVGKEISIADTGLFWMTLLVIALFITLVLVKSAFRG